MIFGVLWILILIYELLFWARGYRQRKRIYQYLIKHKSADNRIIVAQKELVKNTNVPYEHAVYFIESYLKYKGVKLLSDENDLLTLLIEDKIK